MPSARIPSATAAASALLLVASVAAGHGVHDRRGRLERGPDRLVVQLDPTIGQVERGRCLRLLDELEVRLEEGQRLVGSQAEDAGTGACRLDYEVPDPTAGILLNLRPPRRGPPRHERLVLEVAEQWEPLVLSNRSGPLRLPPP